MELSRRNFLRGTAACAVAAAVPLPVLAETIPPIFDGYIGTYNGVIIRQVENLYWVDVPGTDMALRGSMSAISRWGRVFEKKMAGVCIDPEDRPLDGWEYITSPNYRGEDGNT